MEVLSNIASGKAHGKIILIGEHAVVHNEPAIAIPFTSVNTEVVIEKINGDTTIDSMYHQGRIADAPTSIRNIVETFYAVCSYLKQPTENMHLTITSTIPAERGMGSSAAVATALVRALFNFFNTELTDALLNQFVSISEKIAHGNPSGLDAKVVSSGQSIYFIKDKTAEFFHTDLPAYLVIADTGVEGDTGEAVTAVGQLVADSTSNGKTLIKELGRLTNKARKLIEEKQVQTLGEILSLAQEKLAALSVSNDKLDRLVTTAKAHGALGAKLTGGGRGGCMIALVDTNDKALEMALQLIKAGAKKTWIHPLGENKHDK